MTTEEAALVSGRTASWLIGSLWSLMERDGGGWISFTDENGDTVFGIEVHRDIDARVNATGGEG